MLLCFALAVGITTAFYQAQRRAMGSVKMDQGIIIDYKGFNKGDENIWQRETTTTFKLFEERDAQPGEQIYAYSAGIRANAESVDFYARLKLEYNFYNVVGSVETPVALANPKSLITTSSTFFDANWVESTDGYYYYGAGTVLSKFSKDATNYIDIFAKDGEGNVVAKFLIEGANFVGETAGEGGGFVVEDTYINKIVVLLTLETLQGDADAEAEGWKITKSSDQTVDVSGETDADITIDDIISGDRDGEITIAGDPAQPLTITIGSKAFYGCTKLNLTLSNSENIIYQIASDAFSEGATIMYGTTDVSSLVINPSTSDKSEGAANKWQVAEPNLYLFLPSALTSSGSSSYGDYQYTDDQGTWYFDLIDESGNKVSALSSKTSGGVSTLGASTLESTNNYTARINYVDNNSELTTLTIPTYIGSDIDSTRYVVSTIKAHQTENALIKNRSNITLINLPAQLKSIDDCAFKNCGDLTSITIPNSVTKIGHEAFMGCIGLTSITIPDSVTSIGYTAFYSCNSLTSITLSKNISTIESGTFECCYSLISITIPKSVINIKADAFAVCSALSSIIVESDNAKYHSDGNCLIDTANKKLIAGCKNSVIPTDGSVTSIGDHAFDSRNNLTSITIPNSVTSIGEWAFSGCGNLTSITIPDSVNSIGADAFHNCGDLTSIIIPNSVTSIGMYAFDGCSSLTSITIPDSVTSIGAGTFRYCSSLTTINIGAGISETSWLPNNVSSMTVTISENNPYLATDSKAIFAKSNGGLTVSKYISSDTTYEIPSSLNGLSVIGVGGNAFYYCSRLTSITIPNSVTSIGSSAFSNCSALTTITIPDSVTSIGEWAFSLCSSLLTATIGNGVTNIGSFAFSSCSNLETIIIGNSLISIGSQAFQHCESLTSITIPDSVTTIGLEAFGQCKNLTSITIPDSVTSLGSHVFANCVSLQTATIGNGVEIIGGYSFYGCTNLQSITLGSKIKTIGDLAFYDCSNLTTVIWNVTYDLGGVNATGPSITQYNTSSTGGLSITDTLVAPTNIEEGFVFEGWSDGSTIYAAGSDYTFTETNRNLTAVWSKYKVSFDANGGNGSIDAVVVEKGNSITLPNLDNFTREGYVALGWAVDKSATNADYQALASYTPTQSITLYVIWVKVNNDYTTGYTNLIFDLNGGIGKITFEGIYPSQNENVTLPDISGVTKEGSIFLGWSINGDDRVRYAAGQTVTLNPNYRIIAVWHSPITVIITGNGGVGEDIVIAEEDGSSTINLDDYINSFTAPEGYCFANWETNTGRTYSKGQTFNFLDYSENVTIKAVWTALYNDATTGYTNLKFDLNGGTGKVNFSGIYLGGAMITFPEITGVTKEGYVFVGWSNKQDGSGSIYRAGTSSNWSANDTIYAVWSKEITINFDLNGGEGTVPSPITTAYGMNYTISTGNAFTKEGYKFAGWSLVDDEGNAQGRFGYSEGGIFYYTGENYTFKAIWAEPITVTFYNDDTKSQSFTMTGFFAADGLTFPDGQNIIEKEGYILLGWNTSANASWIGYTINSTTNSISNTEFYAVWKTESECAKIVLDLSEVEGQENIVYYGYQTYYYLPDVSSLRNASGQIIIGWSETQYNSSYEWNANGQIWLGSYEGQTLTLYPVWKTLYKITFDANGGEGEVPAEISLEEYTYFEIADIRPTKEGFIFAGWSWNASNSSPEYYPNNTYYFGYAENKTLYAIWAEKITLTFDVNGGEGDVPSPIETYYQGYFDIPAANLTKEGYVLAGWAWESTATSAYYKNGSTNNGYWQTDGRSTLYAVWAVPRTLTFDSNGGQGEVPASIQTYYEGRFEVPSANLTKAGYTFLGWSFTKNLTSTYGGGDIYESGDTRGYGYNADKTLYAVWGEPVTITFDMNDGTGTSLGTATVSFGETFNFPSNPSRTGYNFLGWDYRQNAGNDYYWGKGTTSSNSRFISGSVTIYAQWEVLNNQVYVGSLTTSELAAIQELWSGKSSLSQITDRTLIQNMANNSVHSRFSINAYLNDAKLVASSTSYWDYGFGSNTKYFKLSTNTYVFEFENALPTGWKLVNYRYEVKAQGDVTIVDGKARATVNYSYIESFADQSDNLFLMFVLPSAPEENASVAVSVGALPGNVIGNSDLEGSFLGLTGFKVEIYDASTNAMLWLGTLRNSAIEYRFATGSYRVRIYTTNVVGVGIYNTSGEEVTGLTSDVTYGDGYCEVTINYAFVDGNPDLKVYFKMHDISLESLTQLMTMDIFNGPQNLQGSYFKAMQATMGIGDMTEDEINRAGYNMMLLQEYIGMSNIQLTPAFSLYSSDGYELSTYDGGSTNSDGLMIFAVTGGGTYTLKFKTEVLEMLVVNMETIGIEGDLTPTYNAETNTWDVTFTACADSGSGDSATILMFYTPDIDLSAYEGLPEYDANQDYTGYLGGK